MTIMYQVTTTKIFNTKPSKNTKKIKKMILVIFVCLVLKIFDGAISDSTTRKEEVMPQVYEPSFQFGQCSVSVIGKESVSLF